MTHDNVHNQKTCIINGFIFGLTHQNKIAVLTSLTYLLAESDYTIERVKKHGDQITIEATDHQQFRLHPVIEVSNFPEQPTEFILLFKQSLHVA